ncbi:MAG: lamin tail domain-containing protein [Chloroflexi bacterium]|nr:lamin tail domain-containing protein [Chloroflexota bacterium]
MDLQAEVVIIANLGGAPQDMSGWTLLSVQGNQRFAFPPGFVLNPGATVRVTSGPNAYANPPAVLRWTTQYIWNNDGDPAVLYDSQAREVSRFP